MQVNWVAVTAIATILGVVVTAAAFLFDRLAGQSGEEIAEVTATPSAATSNPASAGPSSRPPTVPTVVPTEPPEPTSTPQVVAESEDPQFSDVRIVTPEIKCGFGERIDVRRAEFIDGRSPDDVSFGFCSGPMMSTDLPFSFIESPDATPSECRDAIAATPERGTVDIETGDTICIEVGDRGTVRLHIDDVTNEPKVAVSLTGWFD